MQLIRDWLARTFSDPQVVVLVALLLVATVAIALLGRIMAPIIAGIVVAYLLHGLVVRLSRFGVPRGIAVWTVFIAFLAVLLLTVTALLPILIRQTTDLISQLPAMLASARQALLELPEQYPKLVSAEQIEAAIAQLQRELLLASQHILAYSVSSLSALATAAIYLVLVPFLVFFFMRDQSRIAAWVADLLPSERDLSIRVWRETMLQIDNYVRGKLLEIVIVGVVTYLVFALMGLQYAALLAVLSGLSTLLPFVGATVVTVPVAAVAYFQWGIGAEFVYVVAAYTVIHMLDGYVLNPLLMSEVVNLHPVAVIVAILFFGGLWGFWGAFFAVPLATFVQAVLHAWPRANKDLPREDPAPFKKSCQS